MPAPSPLDFKLRHLLPALFFTLAGLNHFRDPALYASIIPPVFPAPQLLVTISGAAEIAGGLGLLWPPTCRLAGWSLVALLIAVFPANLHIALHGFRNLPNWLLQARLPFQLLLIVWVWWASLPAQAAGPR